MTESVQKLQAGVASILPLLAANLSAAQAEWMAGDIPRGAYEYCLGRYSTAMMLSGQTPDGTREGLNEEAAHRAAATLFLDTPSALREVAPADKDAEQGKVDTLLKCLVDFGFTEIHPFFGIPSRLRCTRAQAMSSKRRIRRNACTGKVQYKTVAEGQAAVLRLKRSTGDISRFNVYHCPFCKQYHFGRTSARYC